MPTIVVSEFMEESAVADLAARYETLYDPGLVDRPQDLAGALGEARALVVRNRTQVRGALLEAGLRLECIGRLGVGLDNIDLGACTARGIAVYPASGANDLSVAEYVVTAALLLLRRVWFATPEMIAGSWPRERLLAGRELQGKQLGLIGYGAIARETGRRAAALGMQVVAYDPYLPDGDEAWSGAVRCGLEALLSQADVVSLHVPLAADTKRLVDAAALARMKPQAVLINAARGGVVDEAAVASALREGRLGGAALDVFEKEPLDAAGAACFAGVPNLILTPHIAGLTEESNLRVSALTAANVLRHLEGR